MAQADASITRTVAGVYYLLIDHNCCYYDCFYIGCVVFCFYDDAIYCFVKNNDNVIYLVFIYMYFLHQFVITKSLIIHAFILLFLKDHYYFYYLHYMHCLIGFEYQESSFKLIQIHAWHNQSPIV